MLVARRLGLEVATALVAVKLVSERAPEMLLEGVLRGEWAVAQVAVRHGRAH